MKKEYIVPDITIARINIIPLMAGSLTETLKTEEVEDNTEGFTQQAREGGFFMRWEDEDL